MPIHALFIIFILLVAVASIQAQSDHNIARIEFNAGSRTFREQVIATPDSVWIIKEDFQSDSKPVVIKRENNKKDWKALVSTLKNVSLPEIDKLESPSMKRAYDAASHGSLIITTTGEKSYTHGFDDEDPHEKLRPLMERMAGLRKK